MDTKVQRQLATSILATGATLLPLLPIGMFIGLGSSIFDVAFTLHLVSMVWAISVSLKLLRLYSTASTINRLGQCLILLPSVITIICVGVLPITTRDAVIHHLAVPRWWLEAGKIIPIEWHEWSFYPMLINLGFTGFLKLGLPWCTTFYHATFLLFLAALTGIFTQRAFKTNNAGFLGFLVMLTLPLSVKLASSPLVDLGLGVYIGVAILYAMCWMENRKSSIDPVLIGISLGLALGCKYNGLLASACFFGGYLILAERSGFSRKLTFVGGLAISLSSLLTFSPWLVKNIAWSGDPLYPLYQGIFPSFIESPPGLSGVPPITHRLTIYGESWLDIILTPFTMILFGRDGDPRLFDGVLSPLLLLIFVSFFGFRRYSPELRFHAFFLVVSFLLSITFGSSRSRYLLPFIPSAVVLTLDGLNRLNTICGTQTRSLLFIIALGGHLLWSTIYDFSLISHSGFMEYMRTGDRESVISRRIPEFRMIEFINKALPKRSRTYILFTSNTFYYYDRPVFSGGHFSASYILQWIRQSTNGDELLSRFQLHSLTHLMTHVDRATSTLGETLNDREKAIWNEFHEKHLRVLSTIDGFILWEIH